MTPALAFDAKRAPSRVDRSTAWHQTGPEKKKGHSRRSGPKSREETPKKGYETATPSQSRNAQMTVRRTRRKGKIVSARA